MVSKNVPNWGIDYSLKLYGGDLVSLEEMLSERDSDTSTEPEAVHRDLQHRRVTECPGTEWFQHSLVEALDAVLAAMDESARSNVRPALVV